MLTKDILFGMNTLTLVGLVMMGLTLTLNRMGQAGKALSIGLMTAGTALVFAGRRALVTGYPQCWPSWLRLLSPGGAQGPRSNVETARAAV